MKRSAAEALDRRYRLAFAVVAGLVLADQVLVQPYAIRLTTDAPRINVAGRQRMLSQRLAKAALGAASDGPRARAYLEEMKQVIGPWTEAHARLRLESPWPGRASADVREGIDALESPFARLRESGLRLVRAAEADPPDVEGVKEARDVILEVEGEYLARMERVVGLFEREANGRVAALRWAGWAVTGLTLATLAMVGRFLLAPAARLIRRQFAELAAARDDLEGRVAERTQELQGARERHLAVLEQFSHAGRASTIGEMASSLAHELNQPLGAIANYAEGCLIELSSPELSLDDVRSALERLRAATMRAGRMIEQVRRFVTRQGPMRERFDPNRVVEEVLEILEVEARRRRVAVSLELAPGLPLLLGEPVQLQQVLVNLSRNAFESMAEAQAMTPTLLIQTMPTADGGVEFAVTDNGEGIAPDRIDRIFDAYYSTRAGGMGMGLAICRTIVESHGGRIGVESDPGVRTTFRLHLPPEPPEHV